MSINSFTEMELAEILKLTQDGEAQLKKMSDFATAMAEKWRTKSRSPEENIPESQRVQSL